MKKRFKVLRILFSVFALSVFVFLVSGCTPPTQPVNQPPVQQTNETKLKTINMVIAHTGYDPFLITVNRGDEVMISAVTAPGTASHNHGISIDAYGINTAVNSESSPVVIDFVADKPGKFTIYCGTCKTGIYGSAHPDIRGTLEVK